jgi:predicted ATPase
MRRSLSIWISMGYGDRVSQFLAMLAEGHMVAGQVEDALDALTQAFDHVERTGERYYEAEIHRLRGEILCQRGDAPEVVEECYRQAIAVAQRQEARLWELRATISLARLLRDQCRAAEAREALAAIYGWFTEGFDAPGLVEARALLDQLSPN